MLLKLEPSKLSEDFFLAEPSQSLALEPYCWNHGFFRLTFHSLSLDAFAADTLREQTSLGACGEAALGDLTVFFSPSTPDGVVSEHHCVFAASK